ncbi:ParB N-terminal domain-containing protein [Nocardiopsis dassonvillei]|uniref:ParB N-terminal domain-containing protein n=1 Tax=Nocardiopsis dassonvillei TaxID=2014 RepID=UPI00200FAAFE|nr:ParB N-terminal domain-containing protein [Nocardiopsis dassonvillei]MCK9868107.1 ParB N-terminal domain-containing protein [Nocardiopsis dassonvillei]
MLDPDRREFLAARQQIGRIHLQAWPRTDKSLRLVELGIDWVRFSTLNHRTKAEQQRVAHQRRQDDLFSADPFGESAQEAQLAILAGQNKFSDLKEDLLARGQQEPALVTADGVLINGNRRTAAMRTLRSEGHLQFKYVRCLVLPDDATPDEILDLEAELQVARDFREEYSWINEAMMIEELYELYGRDWDAVERRMRRTKNDVQEQHQKLLLVQQLVDQSQGALLPIDFTENESAFTELAGHIRSMSADQKEKEDVKNAYFLGIVSGVNYRDLRHFKKADDPGALVAAELRSESALEGLLTAAVSERSGSDDADPLDDLLGDIEPGETVVDDLLRLVVTKRPESVITLADGSGVAMQSVMRGLSGAVTAAAHEAKERAREQNVVEAPFQSIATALNALNRLSRQLDKSRSHPQWDETAFQEELDHIKELVKDLRETS